MATDRRVKRHLIRRLNTQRGSAATRAGILRAIRALDDTVTGVESLRALALAAKRASDREGAGGTTEEEVAHAWIALNRGLLKAQRISWAQYVFGVGSIVEGICDDRWLRGTYTAELPPADAPGDTNAEYERVLDAKLLAVFEEFGCDDLAVLRREKRAEYDELRERGRRFYFHGRQYDAALRDVVDQLYAGARAAASGAEYRAAVTLLGASLEGHLLSRCLRSARKARTVVASLPKKLRDRAAGDMRRWKFEILVEVCDKADWFRVVHSDDRSYSPAGLAHSLRQMRNWIHPAREAADRPWQGVYAQDFELAHALYLIAVAALRRKQQPRKAPAPQIRAARA
jgi:hypothetical protein